MSLLRAHENTMGLKYGRDSLCLSFVISVRLSGKLNRKDIFKVFDTAVWHRWLFWDLNKHTKVVSFCKTLLIPTSVVLFVLEDHPVFDTNMSTIAQTRNRNFVRGVWELARLHTRESWLCCYPAIWGACVGASMANVSLELRSFAMILFGIWASVTATHCTFCTFNDLCDRNLDLHVERCKTRPLPSGMISVPNAVAVFLAWLPITYAITKYTLGDAAVAAFVPFWVLSSIYPFMKRIIPCPQVVLGLAIGAAVFPGWIAVTQDTTDLGSAVPLFLATACWVVYFDVFYATQDTADDKKIGVKSLAVLMGQNVGVLLSALAVLQVLFFVVAAMNAHLSLIFWVAGLMVWTGSLPWHIRSLDLGDRKSGGRIFKANINLGLYLTAVTLVELAYSHVRVGTLF